MPSSSSSKKTWCLAYALWSWSQDLIILIQNISCNIREQCSWNKLHIKISRGSSFISNGIKKMKMLIIYTFITVRSSSWPLSAVLFVQTPKAALMDIRIAASISFADSTAVEFAAATTVATVPNFVEPLPPKEFTASLWALSTNCVALVFKQKCEMNYEHNITKHYV